MRGYARRRDSRLSPRAQAVGEGPEVYSGGLVDEIEKENVNAGSAGSRGNRGSDGRVLPSRYSSMGTRINFLRSSSR